MSTDPFAGPAVVASEFASVASFRGRLIIIEPTDYEYDVPNQDDASKKADRVTATVTVVDGKGDVSVWSHHVDTGKKISGPAYHGVWISQDRLVKQLREDPNVRGRCLKMVLGRIDTYKPGTMPKKGNPWGLTAPSEADKQIARDFLANRTIAQAASPAEDDDPFS